MSVELWKSIFDWGTVGLVFLTFAFGAGALITGNIINERAEARAHHFEAGLSAQQERAALADAKVAGLEKDASDAKAAQQGVEIELAKQKTRAATAEKALLELQEQRRPRLTAEHERQLLNDLKKDPKGKITIIASVSDNGAVELAKDLRKIFEEANWEITGHGVTPITLHKPYHMVVQVRDANKASPRALHVRDALRAIGISITGESQPELEEDGLVLVVGSKP